MKEGEGNVRGFWLFVLLLAPAPTFADDYWGHRIAVRTNVAYGDDPAQVADLYYQGQKLSEPGTRFELEGNRPTLVWIHGGGWVGGDKAGQFPRVIHFIERGWHVVNLNYRQGPATAPQAVDDVMCAFKWAIEQAEEMGAPTDQFVVSGSSAGGHLALMVGLMNTTGDHPCKAPIAPRAVVNWFGITDIEAVEDFLATNRSEGNYALSWAGDKAAVADISQRYSPLYRITDAAPPIITIHGTADNIVPYDQGEALHAALSTPNELVTVTNGSHGGFSNAQYQNAYAHIFQFLEDH